MSLGQEGGVHVSTCGHHLHLRCLHAYLRSIHGTGQQRSAAGVERGEYLCPVCRQLANAALPLAPRPPRPAPPAHDSAAACREMLAREHPAPSPSKLSEAMGKAMEDITACAGGKLKQRYGSSPAAIFAFVASLVRTNLECELVQRGGNLLSSTPHRYKPRNECIVPLMVVAGAHSRVLCRTSDNLAAIGARDTWEQLHPSPAAAAPPVASEGSAPADSPAPVPLPAHHDPVPQVPLMLMDPTALLMQFLLLAPPCPPYLDMQEFTCIVQSLYALSYYQIVCQFCANATAEGRAALAAPASTSASTGSASTGSTSTGSTSTGSASTEPAGLRHAARVLLSALAGSDLFTEDGPPSDNTENPNLLDMENQLQSLLLPFLRICALLRHHLYGIELPDIQTASKEFVILAYYLELVTEGMEWSSWSAGRALAPWAAGAARAWARQLGSAAARSQLAVRRLLVSLHVEWAQPSLLALPRDYDRLFTYYHERVCLQCGAVPKEASVCLLCGTLVCLKQACCRTHHVAEAVQHAIECGGGTGIFLVVTSTYIIVIRGRRACLWGSLYLDDYDEEDRDLKRGKPLYLSQDRLELLQEQWLAHRFDHTKRTWVWHRDSL